MLIKNIKGIIQTELMCNYFSNLCNSAGWKAMHLCGLIFHTFFYLNAKEPKHQGPETPTKLFLYFLKSQKLAPMLFPLLLRQLLFFNENNSTIFNVCIPLAISFCSGLMCITLVIYVILR